MAKTTRSTAMIAVALGLGAPVVAGCGKGVLSHADTGANVDGPLTVCDPSHLPAGCADICSKAQQILTNDCASCHNSDSSQNAPSAITDYRALVNVIAWVSLSDGLYVVPGNPEGSLLYQRTAILRDMPPPTSDSSYPRPTSTDNQVLAQWIRQCVPDVASPVVPCPSDPPAGSCTVSGMTCPYSTQTCACNNGNWVCQPCPGAQPTTGAACPKDSSDLEVAAPFRCGYGQVTCSCLPDRIGVSLPTWGCGVCPPSQPVAGQACGNTAFACAYGDQAFQCIGGTWGTLLPPRCPSPYAPADNRPLPAACAGFYGCNYPGLDQSCTCKTPIDSLADPEAWLACSCPAAPPATGTACLPTNGPSCAYSEQTCTCAVSGWQCQQTCPVAHPDDGAACNSNLSCSYGAQLCYCDGAAWHCT